MVANLVFYLAVETAVKMVDVWVAYLDDVEVVEMAARMDGEKVALLAAAMVLLMAVMMAA